METFAEPREFVEHTGYAKDRGRVTSALTPRSIDTPILDVVLEFAKLPQCFTLQCCCGHFVHVTQQDPESLLALPARDVGDVMYRIAYLALCIERNAPGARLRAALRDVTSVDPEYVQFGSPGWFWERYPNSYALQVEPRRFKYRDQAVIPYNEALHVERVRDEFFERMRGVVGAAVREMEAE